MRVVPPRKNSTLATVPSLSDAVALSAMFDPPAKVAPLLGDVTLTVGGLLWVAAACRGCDEADEGETLGLAVVVVEGSGALGVIACFDTVNLTPIAFEVCPWLSDAIAVNWCVPGSSGSPGVNMALPSASNLNPLPMSRESSIARNENTEPVMAADMHGTPLQRFSTRSKNDGVTLLVVSFSAGLSSCNRKAGAAGPTRTNVGTAAICG